MEEQETEMNGACCFGCLCGDEETVLQKYEVQNEALRAMFRMNTLTLCYLCKRMAQRAEVFIQGVQSNQILLANFDDIMDITFQSVRKAHTQSLIHLKICPQHIIEVNGKQNEDLDWPYSIVYPGEQMMEFKMEIKLEEMDGDTLHHIETEYTGGFDDIQDSSVKEEDDFPLKNLLKEELKAEDVDLKCLRKSVKRKKVKKKIKCQRVEDGELKRKDIPNIKPIFITRDQCLEERAKMLEDKKYLDCLYKCANCIKGFNFRDSYEKHMEKHSKRMGDEKLQSHKKGHQTRYKCSECGLMRASRLTIKDHYTAIHCCEYYRYNCPHCTKVFSRQVSLRKHICYTHTNKGRVACSYCPKTYANRDGLKAHMIARHPKDEAAGEISKRYICQECGMGFKAPSFLQKHSIKHTAARDFYCVECDKSFKSDAVLQHHLKTALPHINYLELPLACLHCEKRFAIKRDLVRHTNRVHLNIRPYQCDKCDKAYVNRWGLTQHQKLIHEGYKRPMKYACTMCDKVFDRNQILKSHIRTHTGERPYQCTKCPAQFSQSSILGTHVKLIHLKLTRDGRPKAVAMK